MTVITWAHVTWHRIASRDMTQHRQSHRIKWLDHRDRIKWHDKTCQVATNHSSSPHVTSQPCNHIKLLHLTPQATSWHQKMSRNHHHGTAKKWFGHHAFSSILKLPPPALPGTTCILTYVYMKNVCLDRKTWNLNVGPISARKKR